MPSLLKLSESQRTARLRSMPHHLGYRYRSGWGLSMLKAAGYLQSPARGIWQITDRGRDLLASYSDGFGEDVGRRIIRESRSSEREQGGGEDGSAEPPVATTPQAPDELIDAAVKEIQQTVAAELLERIAQAPPVFFEDLVLDLLRALGYGANEDDLERVGGAADETEERPLAGGQRLFDGRSLGVQAIQVAVEGFVAERAEVRGEDVGQRRAPNPVRHRVLRGGGARGG
jgi:restriction system protein